jgi:TonB family protein
MLTPDTILQNRYRIIRHLGAGGMGTVYEAIDERLATTVALKECHFTDERLRKQFEREARLLARLRHSAMTRVIDHFSEGDGQFLVMDFITGGDLSAMLQRRGSPFQPNEVLRWADQLLDALDYLHSQDPPVIHRDIKPQNLKLTTKGQIMLLDFGLAKGFAGQISRVTTSGSIFGYTPNYAPLEQIKGTGTDPRSDLYSLAATIYHLVTGVMPPDVLTRLTATTDGLPDPLRPANEVNPQVSADVAAVLNRALTIGRNQRLATAAEMQQWLHDANQSQTQTSSRSSPLWRLAIPALVILIIGFGIFYALYRDTNIAKRDEPVAPAIPNQNTQNSVQVNSAFSPTKNAPTLSPTKSSPTPSPTTTSKSETPASEPTLTPKPVQKASVSGGVLNGRAISLPRPTYPAIARTARASGTVSVQVTIDEYGNVISAHAVSGHPLLQASAVSAARQAKFSPTTMAGQPVKVTGIITYNFLPQ